MKQIRQKCPWDNKQTHDSLKRYLIEETYETMEAIDHNNPQELKKELGDLLLQIVFHSEISAEHNEFNFNDVARAIADKMVERHPHVFESDNEITAEEVQQNWEKNKQTNEKRESVLSGIPKHLPALLKAQRLQDKAASIGFDWENTEPVIEKLEEEINEFKSAIKSKNSKDIENEFGDILFTLVNLSRFLNVIPEEALQKSNEKFIMRFKYIEKHFNNDLQKLSNANMEQLELVWQKAKDSEK
jgi:MazG family protein